MTGPERRGVLAEVHRMMPEKPMHAPEHQHSGVDASGMNPLGKLCTPLTAHKV